MKILYCIFILFLQLSYNQFFKNTFDRKVSKSKNKFEKMLIYKCKMISFHSNGLGMIAIQIVNQHQDHVQEHFTDKIYSINQHQVSAKKHVVILDIRNLD